MILAISFAINLFIFYVFRKDLLKGCFVALFILCAFAAGYFSALMSDEVIVKVKPINCPTVIEYN